MVCSWNYMFFMPVIKVELRWFRGFMCRCGLKVSEIVPIQM
jgi:hypothetical protein